MKQKTHIGYEIHTLDHTIGKLVLSLKSKLGKDSDLTQMQGWIIGYLYEHTGDDIFQKDIEAHFCIARSTATGILKLMEKKGYLIREALPDDRRLKRLILTEKAESLQKATIAHIGEIEKMLITDISSDDLECFCRVLSQVRTNAETGTASFLKSEPENKI